mmetsp:Transcript_92245/g.176969  ORF Transcript_92245/g.176969 Transcript_92245/m.176969 type:complete len:81 (-) Transcript_92245:4-246(-)
MGIWQHTKKTNSEIDVQRIFSLNGIRLSGGDTSGRMHITGLMRFKKRKFPLLIFYDSSASGAAGQKWGLHAGAWEGGRVP